MRYEKRYYSQLDRQTYDLRLYGEYRLLYSMFYSNYTRSKIKDAYFINFRAFTSFYQLI